MLLEVTRNLSCTQNDNMRCVHAYPSSPPCTQCTQHPIGVRTCVQDRERLGRENQCCGNLAKGFPRRAYLFPANRPRVRTRIFGGSGLLTGYIQPFFTAKLLNLRLDAQDSQCCGDRIPVKKYWPKSRNRFEISKKTGGGKTSLHPIIVYPSRTFFLNFFRKANVALMRQKPKPFKRRSKHER